MSTPTPRPPRRRIAGERRPARPDDGLAPTPEQLEDPVAPDPTPDDGAGSGEVPPAKPPADRAPGRGGPSWPVVAVLGVVALALVTAAAWLGLATWDYRAVRDQDAIDESSRTAPAAAERASAAILSYDYGSLDADEKAAERYMTPGLPHASTPTPSTGWSGPTPPRSGPRCRRRSRPPGSRTPTRTG